MTTRRGFLIGLAALHSTLARAQPAAARPVRVGILRTGRPSPSPTTMTPFEDAMRALGWLEGRNISYERVYAEKDLSRLPGLAAELVAREPALIHTNDTQTTLSAAAATRTIPIVFAAVAEPVEAGLAQSLARPGGNVTGVANIGWELGGKRVQIIREALPGTTRVGVLFNARGHTSSRERDLIEGAVGGGARVVASEANRAADLDAALAFLAKNGAQVLLPTHTGHFLLERKRIVAFAAQRRVPVVGFRGEMAEDGALLSYGASLVGQARQSAQLADKILKGRKPADLPIELPTTFELVVNLRTAKALGITIPQSILLQATRVIE